MSDLNANCDGNKCRDARAEVRVYPLGAGGNLILCAACFAHENRYRRDRGRDSARPEDWPIVEWSTAEPYRSE